jgi:hypothetical protein
MDWTYFASKRFQVAEFQREASTTPVVVPMSKPKAIAASANRGTETCVAEIKRLPNQVSQGGSLLNGHNFESVPSDIAGGQSRLLLMAVENTR